MLVMRLFGCEINCELPFLAHNGPSAQLVRSLRGQSGLNGYSVTCFNQPSLLEETGISSVELTVTEAGRTTTLNHR